MSYEIAPGERIPDEIRRVATELVTRALDGLHAPDASDGHAAVHDARKRGKELRALLRLVRGTMGDAARDENAVVRDAGRTLSDVRDATSVVECVDALRADAEDAGDAGDASEASTATETKPATGGGPTSGADHPVTVDPVSTSPVSTSPVAADPTLHALGLLRDALVDRRTRLEAELDLDARVTDFTRAFEGVAARIPSWPVDTAGLDDLIRAAVKRYGRGRREMAIAASSGEREAYHEWRKRVKDHRYHLRLLRPLWPPVLTAVHGEVKVLSDHLGDEHDLTVVEETLAAEPALLEGIDERTIRDAIAGRRERLRGSALELGHRVYAETRSALERRLLALATRRD